MSQLLQNVGAVIAESDFAVWDVSAACDGFVVLRVRSTLDGSSQRRWSNPSLTKERNLPARNIETIFKIVFSVLADICPLR
jgi:hypothetical protein